MYLPLSLPYYISCAIDEGYFYHILKGWNLQLTMHMYASISNLSMLTNPFPKPPNHPHPIPPTILLLCILSYYFLISSNKHSTLLYYHYVHYCKQMFYFIIYSLLYYVHYRIFFTNWQISISHYVPLWCCHSTPIILLHFVRNLVILWVNNKMFLLI